MKTHKLHYYRASIAKRRREERIYKRNRPITSLSPDPLYLIKQCIDAKLDDLCILSKIATRQTQLPCSTGGLAYNFSMREFALLLVEGKRLLDLVIEEFAREIDSLAGRVIANAVSEHNQGPNAGLRCHYDLGTNERPVALSCSNVIDHMVSLRNVVDEHMYFGEPDMSLIIPHSLANLVACRELKYDPHKLPPSRIRPGFSFFGKFMGEDVYANSMFTGDNSAIALRTKAVVYNFRVEINEANELVRVHCGIFVLYPEYIARSVFTVS